MCRKRLRTFGSRSVRRPASTRRVVGQLRVLAEPVGRIDADPIHAAVQPEPQHPDHRRTNLWVLPVQVRLRRAVGVQVVLAAGRVERPGRPGRGTRSASCSAPPRPEPGRPTRTNRGADSSGSSGRRETTDAGRRCGWARSRPAPGAPAHAPPSAAVEVGKRAERRVHRAVIAHVVAEVDHRRGVERRQPDRIHP